MTVTKTLAIKPRCATSGTSCTTTTATKIMIVDGNVVYTYPISSGSISIANNVYVSTNASLQDDLSDSTGAMGVNVVLAGTYTVTLGSCNYSSILQTCVGTKGSVSVTADVYLSSVSISPASRQVISTAQSMSFSSTLGSGGSGSYSYQWYDNDVAISGATGTALTYSTSTVGTHNVYLVVTDTTYGSHQTVSNYVTVVVVSAVSGSIYNSATKLDVGEPLQLGVIPSGGTGLFNYQWQSPAGTNITGATGNVLLYYTTVTGTATFACAVTDSGLTTPASVTISDSNTYYFYSPLSISLSPAVANVKAGGTVTMTAQVSGGSGNYNYIFYDGGTELTSGSISGTNPAVTYNFSSNTTGAHSVYAQFTDTATNSIVVSGIAFINVIGGISVSISASSTNVFVGDSVNLTAIVGGGSGVYSYQWNRNTTNTYSTANNISGGTAMTYTDTYGSGSAGVTYYYWVTVTDSISGISATSAYVAISVWNKLSVNITASKTNVMVGDTVSFTVSASGGSNNSANYSYNWFLNNSSVSTSSSYSLVESTAGVYSVFCEVKDSVTNSLGISNSVTIIFNSGISVNVNTSATTTQVGMPFILNMSVSGGVGGYSYQWYWNVNSGSYNAGATSQSWTVTENTAGTYGFYCVVKDSAGHSATSNTVTVTVTTNMSITLSASAGTLINPNAVDVITATVYNASGTVNYVWQVNGSQVQRGTGNTYSFSQSSTGVYTVTCVASASNGTVSGSISIRVANIITLRLNDSIGYTDITARTSLALGGNFVVNTGSITTSDIFTVRVNGNVVNAWDINCVKSLSKAGILGFKVAKGTTVNLGDKVEFGYRGSQAFLGYVQSIDKSSEEYYIITGYDGLYNLGGVYYTLNNGIISRGQNMSIASMILFFASKANVGNGISGNPISQAVGVSFGGEAVENKLIQLASLGGYYVLTDNLNNLNLVNYSGATVVTLTENSSGIVVRSKKYSDVYNYGAVRVVADVSGQEYSAQVGTGNNIRQVGNGWLHLNISDVNGGVLNTFAQNVANMLTGGQWVVKIWTPYFYNIGANNVYTVNFADGTQLAGLKLVEVEIDNGGVELILKSFDDSVLGLFETLLG